MRIVPFEIEHVEYLLANPLNDSAYFPREFGAEAAAFAKNGFAFSGIENGHLIGSAGLVMFWPGVAEAWLLASEKIEVNKTKSARAVLRELKRLISENNLHRVQAITRSDKPELAKWTAFLRMRHEGRMQKFGSDQQDYERWAWVR